MKSDFEMQLTKQYRTRTAKLYISLPFIYFFAGSVKRNDFDFQSSKIGKVPFVYYQD